MKDLPWFTVGAYGQVSYCKDPKYSYIPFTTYDTYGVTEGKSVAVIMRQIRFEPWPALCRTSSTKCGIQG